MILVAYKIKVPNKEGSYEIKDDIRLLTDVNYLDVAIIEIRKRFPTAHNFVNKTIGK